MNYALTDNMIRALIQAMPEPVFDSHALIFRIMQRHPQEYVRDAFALMNNNDPIHVLHMTLGTRFSGIGTMSPTRKVKSMNVRGENTENQEWRRH